MLLKSLWDSNSFMLIDTLEELEEIDTVVCGITQVTKISSRG